MSNQETGDLSDTDLTRILVTCDLWPVTATLPLAAWWPLQAGAGGYQKWPRMTWEYLKAHSAEPATVPGGNSGTASECVLMFRYYLLKMGSKYSKLWSKTPYFFLSNLGHVRAFYAPGGYPLRALITAAGTRMQFGRILGHVHKYA